MRQKLLTGLIVVFAFLAAFLSGYFLSRNGLPDKEVNSSNNNTVNILDKFVEKSGAFENIPSQKNPVLLSKNRVASFTLLNTGHTVLYYEKGTGRMFGINLNADEEENISTNSLTNFIKTIWSPDRQKVVSQFYSPSGTQYKYYDLQTKKSVLLNSLRQPAFSPDGNHIVSFTRSSDAPDIYTIVVSEPDGSVLKKLFSTRLSSVTLYWPQDNLLAFEVADNRSYSKLFSLTKDKSIGEILSNVLNLKILWSPSGQFLLFSKMGDNGQTELLYKNIMNNRETLLPITTVASKCAWSIDEKTIVCAMPTVSGGGEDIYEVNILDGTKQLLSLLPNIQVQEILLSNTSDHAIFLNSYDEKLYSLKIK